MKVKFNENIHLEVVTDIIDDVPETKDEVFLKDEVSEFYIIDGGFGEKSQIEFGDGSVCFVNESFWGTLTVTEDDDKVMA